MRLKDMTEGIYLSYVNEFITVDGCAKYYGISRFSLLRIINYWRSKRK
jgi:hypothetical protein